MEQTGQEGSLKVVAAILTREGRVLLGQRAGHKSQGGLWEFPGGKVEGQEGPNQALEREIEEELGCTIEVGAPLPAYSHRYPSLRIEMLPYYCTLRPQSPEPQALEHQALSWVEVKDLNLWKLAEADWPIVKALQAAQ